jgi:hypothetical protein
MVISDNTNQTTKEYIALVNATAVSGNTNQTTKDYSMATYSMGNILSVHTNQTTKEYFMAGYSGNILSGHATAKTGSIYTKKNKRNTTFDTPKCIQDMCCY